MSKAKAKSKQNDNGHSFIKNDSGFHPGDDITADDEEAVRLSQPTREQLRANGAIEVEPDGFAKDSKEIPTHH